MPYIYREYGDTIETTEFEKEPSKVRVSATRARGAIYGERRSDSLRRARQICLRRVSAAIKEFGSPLLCTLTFRGDASDAAFASDALGRFQVRLRLRFPGSHSLFVPEISPRGRIHFHGLVFRVSLSYGDTRKGRRIISYGEERNSRIFAKLWGQGFVDLRQTDGSYRLAHYLSKYIMKAAGNVLFNAMHLIRISQGFPREFVARDLYAEYLVDQINSLPLYEWSGDTAWLGRIEKKWYKRYPQGFKMISDSLKV